MRTLRVRAAKLEGALDDELPTNVLRIPTRLDLPRGEAVTVEISFGALADEVVLHGTVQSRTMRSDPTPGLNVAIRASEAAKLRYVWDVLGGGREAAARCHRRHPSNLTVNWGVSGQRRHAARLRDISRGGAFIVCQTPPPIGQNVDVELRTRERSIRVESVVSWVCTPRDAAAPGFGVSFRPEDRTTAGWLGDLVRLHEKALHESR